jgi:hypothetical protein
MIQCNLQARQQLRQDAAAGVSPAGGAVMRSPSRTRPESVALALQPIQVLVKPIASGFLSNHHVVWAVVAECNELRVCGGHVVCSLVALEVRNDSSLSLVVGEMLANLGAVVDKAQSWVCGRVDVVDSRHRRQCVGLVECQIAKSDVRRTGVPNDGCVIPNRSELVENFQFVTTGIEWGKILGSGWDWPSVSSSLGRGGNPSGSRQEP